jgi:tetratricopeptide (TPR) repeat protein
LSDIFHLQDQIARAVAEALQLAFEPLAHATPIDPVGFDLYLRARTGAPTYVGAHDAGLLEAAVAREPRLAPAWAALALSWAIQAQESGMLKQPLPDSTVSHWRRRAEEAALRALDMDPDAALAHAALAALEPICGACAESRAHLMRALAATPDEPTALLRMGRWCFNIGRITDAMSFAGRAYDLDPLNPAVANDYGSTLYLLERRDEAHGIFEANRERWLETEYVVINPLSLATFWQEWDRVDRLLADLRARGPDTRFVSSQLLRLDALRHHPLRLGEELMTRLRKQLEATGTVSLSVAAQAGWLGSVDAVYPVLARASFSHLFDRGGRLPAGDYGVRWLFGSVHGPMQKDPRFVHLCARLGLCSYWVETDEWPDCAERLTGEYDFKAEARRALAAVSAPPKN